MDTEKCKFSCHLCPRGFTKEHRRDLHVENHIALKYKCSEPTCGSMFQKLGSLTSHCKKQHLKRTKKTMVKKKRTNSSDRKIRNDSSRKCPICSHQFRKKELADFHAENHNKMKYICREPSCGYMFLFFERLCNHYRQKHLQRVDVGKKDFYRIRTTDRVRYESLDLIFLQQRGRPDSHLSNDILNANMEPEVRRHNSGFFHNKNKIQDVTC